MAQTKKRSLPAWVLAAAFFMVALFFVKRIPYADKSFDVVYSQATQIDGYEGSPEAVRIYASPAIKMSQESPLWSLFGWICWIGIPVCAFVIGRDEYGKMKNSHLILAIPVVLCAVCWFAGYSASLDQGSLVIPLENLKTDFGASTETLEQIRHNDKKNIKDESGLLTDYFTTKK